MRRNQRMLIPAVPGFSVVVRERGHMRRGRLDATTVPLSKELVLCGVNGLLTDGQRWASATRYSYLVPVGNKQAGELDGTRGEGPRTIVDSTRSRTATMGSIPAQMASKAQIRGGRESSGLILSIPLALSYCGPRRLRRRELARPGGAHAATELMLR